MVIKTLKDLLNECLSLKNITLEKLAQATGVPLNFLKAIVEEKINQLPPEVYTRGHLKKIAEYLHIDPEEIFQALKRQSALLKSGDVFPTHRFKLRQKKIIIGVVGILLVLLGIAIYLIINVNHHVQFDVTEPKSNSITTNDSMITIIGHGQPLDTIFVNGNPIPVQQNGEFTTTIELIPGLNSIEIESKKLFGGSVKITKEVFYQSNNIDTIASTTP